MEVYQTNPDGVFIGTAIADPDPMDTENWLIPAGCVTIAPPEIPARHMAIWDGAAWAIAPTPQGSSDPAPTLPPTFEQIRAAASLSKIDFCKALYLAQILPANSVAKTAMGEFPDQFKAALAGMSEEQIVDAELAWAGATHVARMAPLFLALLAFYGAQTGMDADATEAFGDHIFGIAP